MSETVKNWFSACSPQGTLGNVWRHFWLSKPGKERGAATWTLESSGAAQHPTVFRSTPIPVNDQGQDMSKAPDDEKNPGGKETSRELPGRSNFVSIHHPRRFLQPLRRKTMPYVSPGGPDFRFQREENNGISQSTNSH